MVCHLHPYGASVGVEYFQTEARLDFEDELRAEVGGI